MRDKELQEILKKNWENINTLMDLRQKQFQEIYEQNWYEQLIQDELYQFYVKKLVEITLADRPTFLIKKELSDEEIKNLASGVLTVKDFMEEVEIEDVGSKPTQTVQVHDEEDFSKVRLVDF